MGAQHMGQRYLGPIGGGVSVKNRGLEGKNGFKTWILAKNGNFQSAPEGIFFNPKTFPLES